VSGRAYLVQNEEDIAKLALYVTIDSEKYTGSITYISVNSTNGFWEFTGAEDIPEDLWAGVDNS
jgi:hypothetical protein